MRRLVLGPHTFVWRTAPAALTVYLAPGHRASPLRVAFPDGPDQGREYIERHGVVVNYGPPCWWLNLNQPSVVRCLTEQALAAGWDPARQRRPFLIDDGFAFLRARPDVLAALAATSTGAGFFERVETP